MAETSNMEKMERRLISAAVVFAILCLSSCKTQYDILLQSNDVDAKYEMAFELLQNKKYSKAASMFESLKLAVRGTSKDDTVQYYTAYAHYMFGETSAAEQGFHSFFTTFPRSPFTAQARYQYIDCLYEQTYRYELDQTPTYKALTAIAEYMIDYPDSPYIENCKAITRELEERLDRKEYESARLYYTIEDYKAASYALKNVLKEDADNIFREDILYYAVLSAYEYARNSVHQKQRERYLDFTDEYYNFVSEYPASEYRKELDALAEKVQNILKKHL